MLCDVCQRDAAVRCAVCGVSFCPDHGGDRCFRCAGSLARLTTTVREIDANTAIYTTERDSRYAGKGYLQCYTKTEMASIYIDDPGPPECYQCQSLAKFVCQNCQQLYCPAHRGGANLCRHCSRSSWLGLWVALTMMALLGLCLLFIR